MKRMDQECSDGQWTKELFKKAPKQRSIARPTGLQGITSVQHPPVRHHTYPLHNKVSHQPTPQREEIQICPVKFLLSKTTQKHKNGFLKSQTPKNHSKNQSLSYTQTLDCSSCSVYVLLFDPFVLHSSCIRDEHTTEPNIYHVGVYKCLYADLTTILRESH